MSRGLTLAVILSIFLIGFFHPDPAQAGAREDAGRLNDRVIKLYREGRYGEDIPLALETLSALEKVYGPNPPEAITVLKYLAKSYKRAGDPAKAASYYARELGIFELAYGPEHIDVAFKRNQLAKLYLSFGDYSRSISLLKKSIYIREKKLGPDHQNLAVLLNRLATAYQGLGRYTEAEKIYIRALAIREKKLGPNHKDTAVSLNNLGAVYFFQGKYDQALPLYIRSLGILEKILGAAHPRVAAGLGNLAELYRFQGNYAKAEESFNRSIDAWIKSGRTSNRDYAAVLNNMGEFYRTLGEYSRAERLYRKALLIMERLYTKSHPDYAATLNNLALLHQDKGQCDKSIELFEKVRTTWLNALGVDHPYIALNLNNLANSYLCLGRYDRAETLLARALPLMKKSLGPYHPKVGAALNNAAVIYESRGQFKRAENNYREALTIFERNYGSTHPDVSMCLHNMARLDLGTGHIDNGIKRYARAQKIDQVLIDQVTGFASEERQLKFLFSRMDDLHVFISQVVTDYKDDENARLAALDAWLRRKGIVLEAQRRFQEALIYSDNKEAMTTFQELARCRAELSRRIFAGPGVEGPAAYQKAIKELEKKRNDLEARLIKLSQTFARAKKTARANAHKIAGLLPPESVLLEFARINMFDFKNSKRLPPHYLVFVLSPGKGDRPALVDLGRVEPIDQAIAGLRKAVSDPRKAKKVAVLAQDLHDKVFAPIRKEIGLSRDIFISPDGGLNLIPFEILRGPDGRWLIEDFSFNYLTSGRDIIGFGDSGEKYGKSLIIGDPDFDSAGKSKGLKQKQRQRSRDMRGMKFSRLPGTLEEVAEIASILGKNQCVLKTGDEAVESALAGAKSPRILHLATHGFFLTDQKLGYLRGDASRGLAGNTGYRVPAGFENPLLRSGLAMAGANNSINVNDTRQSDGLLTAEKVLGLNLNNTELVVLSACETGLGEVKSGEGVYGLRRAFARAGAKGMVMSLWSVPDKETKELMVAFYNHLSFGKMNRAEALRQAVLHQLHTTKERYGHSHPLFWGAFIFLGKR